PQGVGVDDGARPVGGGVARTHPERVEGRGAVGRPEAGAGRPRQGLRDRSEQHERQDGEHDDMERPFHGDPPRGAVIVVLWPVSDLSSMLHMLTLRASRSYPWKELSNVAEPLPSKVFAASRADSGRRRAGRRQGHVRFSSMPYYRRVGDVPRKRHIRFERPGGGLHSEELMGVEGFSADSALLYHRQPPTAIVKAEAVDEAPAAVEVTANRPLLPRHLRTHALPSGGDMATGRRLLLANDDVRLLIAAPAAGPAEPTSSELYRNATGDELVYVESGT